MLLYFQTESRCVQKNLLNVIGSGLNVVVACPRWLFTLTGPILLVSHSALEDNNKPHRCSESDFIHSKVGEGVGMSSTISLSVVPVFC